VNTGAGLPRLLLLTLLIFSWAGCPPREGDVVSDDHQLQTRYELGKEMRDEIRQARMLGKNIEGECHGVERNVLTWLRKSKKAKIKALRRDLTKLCADPRGNYGR